MKKDAKELNILLKELVDMVGKVDFIAEAYPEEVARINERLAKATDGTARQMIETELKRLSLTDRQKYVLVIEKLIETAEACDYGMCKNAAFCYIFNGVYWLEIEMERLDKLLGDVAEKMGLPRLDARQYSVREQLRKQFLATGFLPTPKGDGEVKINLHNGTFFIRGEARGLRDYNRADFLRYVLPFSYDPQATAPMFAKFLDRVLPDKTCQYVLAEYIGWLFLSNFKHEKALILYGSGANGKSVCFEIISALLGRENVSNFTMSNLCEESGYYRAMLMNKLLNYSSEIGGSRTNADTMKQLISGEPLSCRLPYGKPFNLESGYAKLMFNANTLPKDTEQTNAFFRRFLIIPFGETIPEAEQDKSLANKIITSELSGIFNWVLEGLDRLIANESFTESQAVRDAVSAYRKESDSVQLFLEDEGYQKSNDSTIAQKELYALYRAYCIDNGYRVVGNKTFAERCRAIGYQIDRNSLGMRIWAEKYFEREILAF